MDGQVAWFLIGMVAASLFVLGFESRPIKALFCPSLESILQTATMESPIDAVATTADDAPRYEPRLLNKLADEDDENSDSDLEQPVGAGMA